MSDARRSAMSFYFELQNDHLLPETWGRAPINVKTRFRAVLEAEITDLRFCDGHWKADKLASITYPSWCGTHRRDNKIKTEEKTDDDEDDESTLTSDDEQGALKPKGKRLAAFADAPTHPNKKLKPAGAVSLSKNDQKSKKGKGKAPEKRVFPNLYSDNSISQCLTRG